MKSELKDLCYYAKEKIDGSALTEETYISTENMLPDKGGITAASSLPTSKQVPMYRKNDVLVSNIRPYFKKIWFAQNDGGCSNDVLIIRAKDNVDARFLYYTLANDAFFDFSTASAKGTKMPRGDKTAIMHYEVTLFDLETQRKIASILSDIDEKIQINNQINKNLEQQARLIYKDYFVDMRPFNSKMPNDWHLGTASEIIEFHDSKRIPLSGRERANLEKNYPYYGATSIMDYVDKYLFDGIYLLLGEDGTVADNQGFPMLQYVDGKFWVNNHAHVITGKNGFSVEMLYLLFSLTKIRSIITGAVQPKISQSNLSNLSVIIPALDEVKRLNAIIQPIFEQIRNLRSENARLTSIRDVLLTQLISGEIDVTSIDL